MEQSQSKIFFNTENRELLCKIKHTPIIITEIFNFSLSRPFIFPYLISKSKKLQDKISNFQIVKYNNFPIEINKFYEKFFVVNKLYNNLKSSFNNIMNCKNVASEKNYFLSKPNINLLYENNLKEFKYLLDISDKNITEKFLMDFCFNMPWIFLSVHLFINPNIISNTYISNITEISDQDLDYKYLKLLNKNENIKKNQKTIIQINIKNKYFDKNSSILKDKKIEIDNTNIELLINGEKQNLTETYYFDKIGENEVYIIENFYITDMSYMFFYNKSIITLESLRNWDISKVKDMSCMFSWCKSIESLEPLKNWDVSKVEYMNCMFYECEFIKSLEPLQNWDVSNVQYMKDMFKYCKSIDSVEPLKNWNVSNVKHMESIFSSCELIKSFDSISNWCDLTSSFSISQITSKS